MRKLLGFIAVAACAALLVVAPAAAVRDESPPAQNPVTGQTTFAKFAMRAGGTILSWDNAGTRQTFRINLHAGPTQKITLLDPARGVSFQTVKLLTIAFHGHAAKVTGIGRANGHLVRFHAIAVDNPMGVDVFKIAWGGKAAYGGALKSGNVRITQISV